MMPLKTVDSRALPELGWEEDCVVWRAARQMISTWALQLADQKLGRELRYPDLDLIPLFDKHIQTKFVYPALRTCAQLGLAMSAGFEHIALWDDNSVYSQTVRAFALAYDIPFTVHTEWSRILHPRSWAKRFALTHYLLWFPSKARIRWQSRSLPKMTSSGFGVLVLLGSGIYTASALPVLEFIRHSSQISIVPLDYTVDRFLAQREWPSVIPSDYILDSRRSVVRQAQRDLRRTVRRLLQQPDLLALFRVGQVDLAPVARPIIHTLLKVWLPMALPVLEGLQAIIQRECPQIILSVPDRLWRAKAAIELGHQANIPSLTIQAAVISKHPRYNMIVADRVAVIGETSRRLWEDQGIPPEKLVVTGAPQFDDKYQLDPDAPERIRAVLGVPLDKPIITFATQPLSPAVIEQNIRHIVQAADRFPDYQLVFKVHPREDPDRYRGLLAGLGAHKIIVIQKIDLNALLQASAMVITGFSTVALEAMIFERPVLIVNLTGEPDPVDYVSSGATLGAYAPEDIVKQMERLLTDSPVNAALAESRRRYIMAQLYKTDGRAAQRVAELIQQMTAANISQIEVVQ
jgi:glycosyltransferase involved in cell wall biosynthesis